MAKKGKHLSAATRQKISESVKRATAARLAKAESSKRSWTVTVPKSSPGGAVTISTTGAGGGGGSTPRTSKEESAVQVAIDVAAMLRSEPIASSVLVRVVDRILRP